MDGPSVTHVPLAVTWQWVEPAETTKSVTMGAVGGGGGEGGGGGGEGRYTYTSAKLRALPMPGSLTVMKLPVAPAQFVVNGPIVEGAVCAVPPQSVPPVLPAESPTQIS